MTKFNPWIVALWTIGVVLVGVAWAAGVWQASFYYQSSEIQNVAPVVEFLQRLADSLISPALIVGFATLSGLLFLHTRNHARKVRRESSR